MMSWLFCGVMESGTFFTAGPGWKSDTRWKPWSVPIAALFLVPTQE
jgi:hypothetical protein